MYSHLRITLTVTAASVALFLFSGCSSDSRNAWSPSGARSDMRQHLTVQCRQARAELPEMRRKYAFRSISFLELSDFEIRLYTSELRLLRMNPEKCDREEERALVRTIAGKYRTVLSFVGKPSVPAEERNAWSLRAMDFFAKEPDAHDSGKI